jgi:tRNA (cytidine/uridine-2'-O-)-methyltransferase
MMSSEDAIQGARGMKRTHARKGEILFNWPQPPLRVVLVEPQIPPNAGNVARLCAATGTLLHLIEPMGFRVSDTKLKRAGLDYWDSVVMAVHPSFDDFIRSAAPPRFFLFTTGAFRSHSSVHYQLEDTLVFGSETHGLPDSLLECHPDQVVGIPIRTNHVRSLNLSSAVAIAVYEALRQFNEAEISRK